MAMVWPTYGTLTQRPGFKEFIREHSLVARRTPCYRPSLYALGAIPARATHLPLPRQQQGLGFTLSRRRVHQCSASAVPSSNVGGASDHSQDGTDPRAMGADEAPGGAEAALNPGSLVQDSVSAALDQAMNTEESKALLRDLVAAEERVAHARAEMEEMERQEKQLLRLREELQMQAEADERLAAAQEEVTKLLTSVSSAEEEVRMAGAALLTARSGMADPLKAERIESVKGGAAAAVGGVLAYLPLCLGRDFSSLAFGLTSVAMTCLLFGITFRYAVRQDTNNVHLKSGVLGAFALTQAVARVDTSILNRANESVSLEDVLPSLLSSGEAILALLAGALCLEYCLQQGLVQRFPCK